jgi:biotin transport system substrate-specific component
MNDERLKKRFGRYTTMGATNNDSTVPLRKSRLTIHELCSVALMAALLALLAQIAVPVGAVPFSLQTVGVIAAALLLSRKNAVLAIIVYLLLGLAGLPVFAGGRAGLGILAGPSGGFLFGFIPAVWLSASLLNKGTVAPLWRVYLAAFAAMPCYFVLGTLQYAFVLHMSVAQAFVVAALPFLAIDAIKIAIMTPLIWKMRRLLHQQMPRLF